MNSFFRNKGNVINGVRNLSPREVFEECKNGAVIIDMRRDFEIDYKKFDVGNVRYECFDCIKAHYDKLPKDEPLIFADQAGIHSKEIALFLLEKGFENTANLSGGIFEWDRDGLPLITDNRALNSDECRRLWKRGK